MLHAFRCGKLRDGSFQFRQQFQNAVRFRSMSGKSRGMDAIEEFSHDRSRLTGPFRRIEFREDFLEHETLRLRSIERRGGFADGIDARAATNSSGWLRPRGGRGAAQVPAHGLARVVAAARLRDARPGNPRAAVLATTRAIRAQTLPCTNPKPAMRRDGQHVAPPAARRFREAGEDRLVGLLFRLGGGSCGCGAFGRGRRSEVRLSPSRGRAGW